MGAVPQTGMNMTHRDDRPDDLEDFIAQSIVTDPAFAVAHERASIRSGLIRAMVAYRKRKKRSQTAVANGMGTTQSAISEFESGASDPRFSTLDRYATAIGCRLQIELLTQSGERLYVTPSPWRATAGWGTFEFDLEDLATQLHKALALLAVPVPQAEPPIGPVEEPLTGDNYALAA